MTKTIHIQYSDDTSENLMGDYYFVVDEASGILSVFKNEDGEIQEEAFLVVGHGFWKRVRYVE